MHSKILIGALLVLTVLLTQTPTIDGAKILAVYVFPGTSHFQMHRVIIKELVKHGHEVTMITAKTLEPLKLGANYTEILIEPEFDFRKHLLESTNKQAASEYTSDVSFLLRAIEVFGVDTTEHALQQPNVQAVINAKQTKGVYDLLLVEQFFQDALLAFAHVYDIPVISTSTLAYQGFMDQMFGLISPLSYVHSGVLPLHDRMTFWERIINIHYTLRMDFDREFNFFPKNDELVKKYFGHLAIDFPSTSDMTKNLSATLINNYTPLLYPAPGMDNIVNVGGMHIYPNKPLPSDLQTFLDDADYGVIYFSFGTVVLSKDLPPETLNIFLDVFRTLKQRVLWKFENDSLANVPNNVMIKSWMPQNDILAHPNVRVFISHGGLFGTQEAVYHGVPVVGIPFLADQYMNVKKGAIAGFTLPLDIKTLTRDDLKNALHKVLYEPSYRDTMKRMSKIFRDRPMGPRETAMYWIDYVIRHKGTPHLRAAGLDLKWYQFYLLDVIALFVAAVAVAFTIIIVLVYWCCRKFKNVKRKHEKVQ